MKKYTLSVIAAMISIALMAQQKSKEQNGSGTNRIHVGLKGGYNVAWITGTKGDFNPSSKNGFMVAGFISPASRGGLGFRSEVVFSRQGFSYDDDGQTGNVSQDYIYLPQLTTFSIGKFMQIQAGAQMGILLNAKSYTSGDGNKESVTEFFKKIDYGFAGGVEVYPFAGLLLGARYNISLGDMYKKNITSPLPVDPSTLKGRHSVVQFFAGYRF